MDEPLRRRFSESLKLPQQEREKLFRLLWQDWFPRLNSYFRLFARFSREDREELASDTIIKAFEKAGQYRSELAFEPWLYAIARRLALSKLRRKTGNELARDPGSFEAGSPYPEAEQLLLERAERLLVGEYLSGLKQKERELVYLVYAENLSLRAAARLLNEPEGTAKWRLSRIRLGLKQKMEAVYA